MKIIDKFNIEKAKSKAFGNHKIGNIPFISNGFDNNGFVGFVKPLQSERIFNQDGICISAFCEATVQKAPFLPRGNGGSGLTVLIPKEKMNQEQLHVYAGLINTQRWRFSFGRMVISDRLSELDLPNIPREFENNTVKKIVNKILNSAMKQITKI
ncbi:MAG: hypothetical protein Q7R70_01445 [Candidatus Diapherotrites archaeon]|nr:hypothetical protein [Candidatus Diapherotrites archaeon]